MLLNRDKKQAATEKQLHLVTASNVMRRILHVALMAEVVAIDKAECDHRLVGALEGSHPCCAAAHALGPNEIPGFAASQLVIKLLPKTSAEQVESKRVYARVSKCQDPSTEGGDKVQDRSVHLRVMV